MTKRLTFNGLVGLLLVGMSGGGFVWTFYSALRPMELFVPRISFGLMALGGALIFAKDALNSEKADQLKGALILPYAAGVSLAMWAYGWAFRNIGLVTATFTFLAVWWVWVAFRDARRKGSFDTFWLRAGKLIALAVVISIVVHLLFISLLRMHVPRTPLP